MTHRVSTVAVRRGVLLGLGAAVASVMTFGAVLITIPNAQAAPSTTRADTYGVALAATPTPAPSPQRPTAPTNLTAVARSTSITLNWTASQPGCCPVESYRVVYKQTFNDIPDGNVTVTGTTATLASDIRPATEYQLSVSARDTAGNGSPSTTITVVTPATDTGPDTVPPSTPTGLTGSVTGSQVTLNWSPSADNVGVVGYRIYHFDGVFISTLVATVTGTTYTGPLRYGRNQFYVRAVDAAGNVSIASDVFIGPSSTATPTSAPTSTPSTSPTPAPTLACRVTYAATQWPGGLTASLTIENTSSTAVNGWTLAFTFGGDQRISTSWGAAYTQAGAEVTAPNLPWNAVIAPNGRVTTGFVGSWTTSTSPPTRFTLNGSLCQTRTA